jgi:ABC-type nickel/cobalt efflux system permease component RcnA
MLVLGLLLILGSAALGAGVVYDGNEAASVEILGTTVDTTAAGIFFSGAATMLLFLLGLWLVRSKMGRDRRKRGERKETRRRQRESVSQIEEERTQLRAENERLSEKLGTHRHATDEKVDVNTRQDTTSTTT